LPLLRYIFAEKKENIMYKLLLLIAFTALLSTLAACGNGGQETPTETTVATTTSPATTPQPPDTSDTTVQGSTVIIYTANMRGDITVLPQIAALREYYQSQGMDVILVDLGNFLQGTIYAAYDSGRTVIELMDMAGYDVVVIGASEFAFGTGQVGVETHGIIFADDSFGYLIEQAGFYAVSANIIVQDYNVYAFQPYVIIQTSDDASVAITGTTDARTQYYVIESTLDGLFFSSHAQAIDDYTPSLQANNIVVVLSNAAPTSMGVINDVTFISARLQDYFTAGVVIIDNATGQFVSQYYADIMTLPLCPDMQNAVSAAHDAAIAEFDIWARSEVTLEGRFAASRSGETNLGNLWADALLWFAHNGIENFFDEDDIDAGITGIMVDSEYVVAIWNGGNLRDFIHNGDVTMRDLQRVLPFPNRVAVMYLYGEQLLEMLEAATQGLPFSGETFAATAAFPHVAGINFTVNAGTPFDTGEPHGNHWFRANSLGRVTINSINGNPFDPAARYAIITSNAIFNGMDSNYISLYRCEDYSAITSAMVVDVVWMYVMNELGGIIGSEYAAPQGRITVLP